MISPHSQKPVVAPSQVRDRLLLLIGTLGPLGHLPASGTATVAIVGIPCYWATRGMPLWLYLLSLAALTLFSVWIHQRGDALLRTKDSSLLVWDEIVGFLVAVIALPFSWKLAVIAFLLERALDILKVWPARWIENHWPGGWGVVGDDLVAGLYTLGILHLLYRVLP